MNETTTFLGLIVGTLGFGGVFWWIYWFGRSEGAEGGDGDTKQGR